MKRQIGAWKSSPHPAFDSAALGTQRLSHSDFCGFSIGPGRRC
jgi:hypothetical protein